MMTYRTAEYLEVAACILVVLPMLVGSLACMAVGPGALLLGLAGSAALLPVFFGMLVAAQWIERRVALQVRR